MEAKGFGTHFVTWAANHGVSFMPAHPNMDTLRALLEHVRTHAERCVAQERKEGFCVLRPVLMLVLVRKATNWLFASFETNTSRSLEPFRSERKRSVFGFVSEPKGNRVSYFAMAELVQAVDSS